METVHVRRLAIRCRVASTRETERARARRIFQEEVTAALEEAVAQSGIGPDEEVCIRSLRLSARLWMGLTDEALRRAWADSLAAEIRRVLATRDTASVVRYGSSRAAVIDALRSVARGDFSRQWAWEQLRLTTAIVPGGRRADFLCDLLLSHATAIVPALRALREEPAFWQLFAALEDEQIVQIAEAALTSAGVTRSVAALCAGAVTNTTVTGSRAQLAAARARTATLLRRPLSRERSVALAVLAILEAEPTLLRGDTGDLRGAIATVLDSVATMPSTSSRIGADTAEDDLALPHVRRDPVELDEVRPRAPRKDITDDPATPPAGDEQYTAARDIGVDGHHRDEVSDATPASPSVSPDQPQTRNRFEPPIGNATDDSADTPKLRDDDAAAVTIDGRVRAHSEWAGLLLLINVIRDNGLIDELLDDPALAERSSQWVLHRLVLAMVPAAPDDAAVLAFAGLDLRQCPPEFDDEAATADEQAALLRHARRCIEQTRSRFDDGAGEDIFYAVCVRPGEIVADPGWIEIRFPVSTIAVPVRRAGLDLDPGYVAWLGVVVKFAYV